MSNVTMVKGPRPHIHSVWLYWGVFGALVLLTVATVLLSEYDFGKLNIVVTLMIAGTKASLVMGIFMHLASDSKFLAVVAATSLVFLILFILFPILDFGSRDDIDYLQQNFLPRDERIYQYERDHPGALPLRPGLQEANKDQLIFTAPGQH